MNIIERVAQALDYARNEKGLCRNEDLARVAVAAMREPTEDMLNANDEMLDAGHTGFLREAAIMSWKKMIDVALEDK